MLEPHTAAGIVLATATVVVGLVCLSLVSRRAEGVRSERELIATLGMPIVAARPLAAADLARQLSAHWFDCGRPVLAVVSAETGDNGTQVAAELARALARRGEPTLLIDADFRDPSLHRAFGLPGKSYVSPRITQLYHTGVCIYFTHGFRPAAWNIPTGYSPRSVTRR